MKQLHVTQIAPERIQAAENSYARARKTFNKFAREYLIAGYRFLELKYSLPDGDFCALAAQRFPDITERCRQVWQRNGEIVLAQIPCAEMPYGLVADILESPEEGLSVEHLQFKHAWEAWVSDKSLRQIAAVGHATTRSLNGSATGGTTAYDNRKDFPLFGSKSLKVLSDHISHWDNLDELQKTEIINAFASAISGKPLTLDRKLSRTFKFNTPWPADLCKAISAAIKKTHTC